VDEPHFNLGVNRPGPIPTSGDFERHHTIVNNSVFGREASDGLEALQKAVELRPDLILLDIGRPNLNGIEVARQLLSLVPKSKILFLTQESSADVVQEALSLHNATKHSGVKRIDVQLREDSHEIHLMIRDSGKGFDVEAAMQGKGLGLSIMRERVRLVNGTISIESKKMGGTTIHVRVPLESQKGFQREAV